MPGCGFRRVWGCTAQAEQWCLGSERMTSPALAAVTGKEGLVSARSTQALLLTQGRQTEALPLTPLTCTEATSPLGAPTPSPGCGVSQVRPVASWEAEV